MTVNVNRIPFNEIPESEAFHPQRGPLWRKILDILNQSRSKIGGDSDFIVELQGDYVESEAVHNYDIRQLQADRDKYHAEYKTARAIRNLKAENEHLKASLLTTQRQLRTIEQRLNQLIAETQTNA